MSKRKWDDAVGEDWIKFNSKSREPLNLLSNFTALRIRLNGRDYPTGEAAFHGEKYRCVARHMTKGPEKDVILEYASEFQRVTDPVEAKKMGGKKGYKLTPEQLEAWDKGKMSEPHATITQRAICNYKCSNYEAVRKSLLSTESTPLLHQDNRARKGCVWGGRVDKATGELIGNNRLGEIWMEIRENTAKPA